MKVDEKEGVNNSSLFLHEAGKNEVGKNEVKRAGEGICLSQEETRGK